MSDYHGAFFGDLFTDAMEPARYSCSQHADASAAALLDTSSGAACDSRAASGPTRDGSLRQRHMATCASVKYRSGEVMNPLYTRRSSVPVQERELPTSAAADFHPSS